VGFSAILPRKMRSEWLGQNISFFGKKTDEFSTHALPLHNAIQK